MKRHPINRRKPIPAATIILTREHAAGFQVYLLKRSSKSGFMAGNFVFPGGSVDAADRQGTIFREHVDLDSTAIRQRFGGNLTEAEILTYCVAAVRETLEEAGVFLARRQDEVPGDVERIRGLAQAANRKDDWFATLVSTERWCLRLSELARWSHWITPELMSHRYDTRFFLAAMPPGQSCRPDFRETVQGVWISPEEGLAGNLTGNLPLSPPTLISLHELLGYRRHGDLQNAARNRPWGAPLLPRLVPLEKGALIVEPWDPMYGHKEIRIATGSLAASVLAVGEPFSRIWHHEGIWKPVKCLE